MGMCKFLYPQQQQVQVHSSVSTTVSLLSSHTTYNRGSPFGTSDVFKYLGVHLSCDLSWSMHIQTITSRARKVVGLLYQKFYNFSPPAVLLCLYLSLVRQLLEYASVVWSPYLKNDILQQENVQKFGLCMATKLWAYPYDYVLYRSQLNSLEIHRTITRLCTLFILFH